MDDYQTVCSVDEITEGKPRTFTVGGQRVGVFLVDKHFYAIDDRCPHAGASLTRGHLEGEIVRCRIHHWGFCLRSGRYVDQDRPTYDARTYPLRVVDGEIQIKMVS